MRLVKRVVAVPGDTIELRNNVLLLNGEPMAYEPVNAQAYAKESSTAQALHDILSFMLALADRAPMGLEVRNPANTQEVLSELWVGNAAAYDAFRTWLRWFAVQWDQVRTADSIPAAERELEALFGEDVVKEALRKHATDTSTLRKAGRLNVTRAGGLTSAASISSVRPNTFFGK